MADDIMKQAMSTIFDGDPSFFDEEPSQTFDEVPNQTLFQPVFITQSGQPGNVNYQMRMNTVQNSGANLTPRPIGSQQVLLPQMRPVQIGLPNTQMRPSLGANVANSSMLQQLRIQPSGGQTVMISNPTSTINPLTGTGTLRVVRPQPHSGGKTTVLLRSAPGNLVANSSQAMPVRMIPRQPVQPTLVRFQPASTTPLPIKRVQSFSGTTGIQMGPNGSQLAQSPIVQLVTRPAGQQLVVRPDATKSPLMVVVPQSSAAVGSAQPRLIKVATVPNMATSMPLRLPGQPRLPGQQLQVVQGQSRMPGQTVQIIQGQPRQLLPTTQGQLLQTVPGQSLSRLPGQTFQIVQRPRASGQRVQIAPGQSSLPGQQIQIVQGQPLQRQTLQRQPLQGQQKIVVQTASVSNSTHTPVIICRSNSPAVLNSIARNSTPATFSAVPTSTSSFEPAAVSKYSSTVQTSSLDRLSISNIPAQTAQPGSCDSSVASFIPEHPIPNISGKPTDNSSTVSHNVVTVSSSGPPDFSLEDLLNTDNFVPTGACDELDALFGITADVKKDVKIEEMDTEDIKPENVKSESVKLEDVTVAEDAIKVEIKSEDVKVEPADEKEIKVKIENSQVKVEKKEADVKFNIGGNDDDDDDTFDFFKAFQELQETNKKAEEYEATLRAKEEENKRKDKEFASSNLSTLLPNVVSQSTSSSSNFIFSSSSLYTSQATLFSSNSFDSVMADAYNSSTTVNMNLNSWDVPEIPLSIGGQPYVRTFGNRMAQLQSSQLQSSASNRFFSGGRVISGMPAFGSPRLLHSASVPGGLKTILVGKTTGQVVVSTPAGLKMERDVTKAHWSSDAIETRMLNQRDEEDAELEELGHAETYADYMPQKLKIGCKHPDPVVESSSLSSVDSPDVTYQLKIANKCIEKSLLSALQLESVTYVCQKHETYLPSRERFGYLIGDGAGVGKGRTIAGIIYENLMHGRKRSLWLSVSNDLMEDAIRDLRDIGCDLPVFPLNKFKYGKLSSSHNNKVKEGVVFATYSSLISEMRADNTAPKYMKKYNSRLKQLINWLGKKFDGLIIFDECHRAKNLYTGGSSKPTKTGQTVVKLQKKLPNSRVVYASATGASEPRNMAYMTRLGLWGPSTPFKDFSEYILAVEKRGVGAMELVAMEMKQRGCYIARQLSFKGVSFNIEEVGITKEFKLIYNRSVDLWVDLLRKFNEAIELLQLDKQAKHIFAQFWSSHQRFFKYLCISAKVQHCILRALNAVKNGKCVVIGLQSTGEARIKEMIEDMEEKGEELQDFISSTKGVIQKLIETYFPTPNNKKIISDLFASDSPTPSSAKGRFNKHAGANTTWNAKRQKVEESVTVSDDEEDDEMDSASEKSEEAISVSDGSDFEDDDDESDRHSSGSESDDNPFANGNDLPWLKQKKESQSKKAKKKEEKEEKKKETEKKKEKEREKKKEKSAKKRKRDEESDDDDDDYNFDEDESVARVLAGVQQREAAAMSAAFASKRSNNFELTDTQRAEKVFQMKQSLLADVEELGKDLPPNTLDELIDALGGPSCVAEMTGRKSRIIASKDGVMSFEKRSESDVSLEKINLAEKKRFMDGEKLIAIISEAASSGISLQADRRAINQRRRVHITLELPWSADRAVQQFGRTHRSNQVSAPEYIFLISNLAGERRFAATVAKRLESLGALTHGDRRATETRDLSQFNIDNKYGISALDALMKAVDGEGPKLVPPPSNYKKDFFADVKEALVGVGIMKYNETSGYSLEKDSNNMNKFLNRILGMHVDLQNALFQYFQDTHKYIILKAKREKHWDLGILDLGSSGEKVHEADHRDFHGTFSGIRTKVVLSKVLVERGLTFEAAEDILLSSHGSDDGFYESRTTYAEGRKVYFLAIAVKNKNKTKDKEKEVFYKIYRANAGLQACHYSQAELLKKGRRVADYGDIKPYWDEHYAQSENSCMHVYQFKNCARGDNCELGRRAKIYFILSGSVLSVWTSVERVLASLPGGNATRMQIIRLRTDDGRRIVGTLIPGVAIEPLKQMLSNPDGTPTTSSLGASQSHLSGGRSSPAPLVRPMQWTQQPTNVPPSGMFRQGGKDRILSMPSLL